jgi:hypothetical protein
MQHYCKTIGALAAASALVAGTASAEVEYEIHTGYSTMYLFRGIDLGDNLTEFGVDAASEWNGFGLSAGVWSGVFGNTGTGNDVDMETDLYAEASYDVGFTTLSAGYIYYWNLGSLGVDDQEVYFGTNNDFGWASLSFTYFWDVVENNGGNNGYSELTLSESWELNPCVNFNLATTLGMHLEDFMAVPHWTTKASLDWGFTENAKLSPFVAVSIALDEDARTAWADTENEYVIGTMLSASF